MLSFDLSYWNRKIPLLYLWQKFGKQEVFVYRKKLRVPGMFITKGMIFIADWNGNIRAFIIWYFIINAWLVELNAFSGNQYENNKYKHIETVVQTYK